jgi:hypothetical protein
MSSNEATGQPRSSPVESESALGLEPASLGALAIGVIAIGLLTRRSPTLSEDTSRSGSRITGQSRQTQPASRPAKPDWAPQRIMTSTAFERLKGGPAGFS